MQKYGATFGDARNTKKKQPTIGWRLNNTRLIAFKLSCACVVFVSFVFICFCYNFLRLLLVFYTVWSKPGQPILLLSMQQLCKAWGKAKSRHFLRSVFQARPILNMWHIYVKRKSYCSLLYSLVWKLLFTTRYWIIGMEFVWRGLFLEM